MANENLDQLKIELEKQLNQLFNSQDNFNQGSKEIVKKKKISNFSKSQFNGKTKNKFSRLFMGLSSRGDKW